MRRRLLLLSLIWFLPFATQGAGTTPVFSFAKNACSRSEAWRFGSQLPRDWRQEFELLLKSKQSSVQAFSEALALRRLGIEGETTYFSEYWISRALIYASMPHMAHRAFSAMLSKPITPETAGIQLAALQCLTTLQSQYPSLGWAKGHPNRVKELQTTLSGSEWKNDPSRLEIQRIIWEGAASLYRQTYDASLLQVLKGSGPHYDFATSVESLKAGKLKEAAMSMEKLLKYPKKPNALVKLEDFSRIYLARIYFELGDFQKSVQHLNQVERKNNDLAQVLSELSWNFLKDHKYGEAIGTAMNLQQGALFRTFAPESIMVMAMALNELCQYPQSIRAIDIFRSNYKDSYLWLSQWKAKIKAKDPSSRNLYPHAIAYLKGKGTVPDKVVTEWVRSSQFIARQSEMNLLFDERSRGPKVSRAGDREQQQRAAELLTLLRKVRKEYELAKLKLAPGETLSAQILARLKALKDNADHYQRLRAAAPVWVSLLAIDQKLSPEIEGQLLHQINGEMMRANLRMIRTLDSIAENNQLIEVEIYNGASQDIIWQNAHPDYEQVAQQLKGQGQGNNEDQVWNWGTSRSGLYGGEEVWEDELGSFKADLYDNCSSKEKYLAVKSQLIRERALTKLQELSKGRSISSKSEVKRGGPTP